MLFNEFDSNYIFKEKALVQILPQEILHDLYNFNASLQICVIEPTQ